MAHTIWKRASMLMAVALFCCASALAQNGPIEGTVKIKGADGKMTPVADATILIHRTDIKGDWTVKTDKHGRYVRLGMPLAATYLVIAHGPGMEPTYLTGIRLAQMPVVDIIANPGDGRAMTVQEALAAMKQGSSAAPSAPQQPVVSEADRARAAKEKEEQDKAVKEHQAMQEGYKQAVARYNVGIGLMQAKNFDGALTEFEAASSVDPAKHEALLEIAYKAFANVSEAHYQLGVTKFNNKQKNEAKPHFEKAVAASLKALELAATNTKDANINNDLITYYSIYGKNVLLLIEHYGMTDLAPKAAESFDKAAGMDANNKHKWLVMKGDAYRASSMSEEAAAAYKVVIDADPKNFDALYKMGLTYLASAEKEKLQLAANYLDAFVTAAPATDSRVAEAKSSLQVLKNEFKVEAEKPTRRPQRKP